MIAIAALLSLFVTVIAWLGAIITFILTGWLGWFIASKVPMWRWVGAVIGVVFHLGGCLLLALLMLAVWGVRWWALGPDGRALHRINKATAVLESYGYTVKEPPAEGGA